MAEYALVAPLDNRIDRFAFNVDPDVQTKAGFRWLPVVVTNPSFNPKTEVKEGPVVTVNERDVSRVWAVRSKTAEELDADKEITLDSFDMLTLKALFNHENRVRALEGKAAITQNQFRTALKAML